MSAHRLTFPPPPERRPNRFAGLVLIGALGAATVGIGALVAFILHAGAPGVQITPVRTTEVVAFPLEPIDAQHLAQIRAEAFRAGFDSATQAGCSTSTLAAPIASR